VTVATVEPSVAGPYATQPWNQVIWPGSDLIADRVVWDASTAAALPSVGRALGVIGGGVRQMPMDDYRGIHPQPRPRLLEQPDPNEARSWFVGQQVVDYLLHGNALSYVTARNADAQPAAAVWLPAQWVTMTWDPSNPRVEPGYWVGGRQLDPANVVHVKRGADPWWPVRGVGVVEQHMIALDQVGVAARYQASALSGNGVPSVAVITPNPRLDQTEADAAADAWMEKFAGPVRRPAILPAGTTVVPLAWSPEAAQLAELRKLGLLEVANMFNLDGYYLGVENSGLTYKSPGPQFLALTRITLEPILADFEGVWSWRWLPRGHRLRFDRQVLLTDDLSTTVQTLRTATEANLMTIAEARIYLGLPVLDDPATPDVDESNPAATVGGTP
jgi:HK97 family phage portal protein